MHRPPEFIASYKKDKVHAALIDLDAKREEIMRLLAANQSEESGRAKNPRLINPHGNLLDEEEYLDLCEQYLVDYYRLAKLAEIETRDDIWTTLSFLYQEYSEDIVEMSEFVRLTIVCPQDLYKKGKKFVADMTALKKMDAQNISFRALVYFYLAEHFGVFVPGYEIEYHQSILRKTKVKNFKRQIGKFIERILDERGLLEGEIELDTED
ncbi:MAG: hypothetical protein JWM56_1080 [Candidatus Peribacteria bacterium]|nr:hypothetical protein [Candidatus Peribacteria bacterium]